MGRNTKTVREISDEMCQDFQAECQKIAGALSRSLSRYDDFQRDEWLGGGHRKGDATATQVGPARTTQAHKALREALRLVNEADHLVALYRALGDDG